MILVVSGEDKADILRKVIEGPVTPKVPASILKFHPYVTNSCRTKGSTFRYAISNIENRCCKCYSIENTKVHTVKSRHRDILI